MIEVWNLFLLLILSFYFPPEPRSGAAKIHITKWLYFLELELEIERPVFPAPVRKGGFGLISLAIWYGIQSVFPDANMCKKKKK